MLISCYFVVPTCLHFFFFTEHKMYFFVHTVNIWGLMLLWTSWILLHEQWNTVETSKWAHGDRIVICVWTISLKKKTERRLFDWMEESGLSLSFCTFNNRPVSKLNNVTLPICNKKGLQIWIHICCVRFVEYQNSLIAKLQTTNTIAIQSLLLCQ